MNYFPTVFLFTDDTHRVFGQSNQNIATGILGIGIGIVILGWFWFTNRAKTPKSYAIILVVIWIIGWISYSIGSIQNGIEDKSMFNKEYQELLSIYNNHQYRIAEGVVHVLHQQPASGHDEGDIIVIGETELEINFFVVTFGYKDTIAHNGVLREGVYARIYYTDRGMYDTTILRIDIKNSD
jgi:hypothetical protein